jgi:hypothetical protein
VLECRAFPRLCPDNREETKKKPGWTSIALDQLRGTSYFGAEKSVKNEE